MNGLTVTAITFAITFCHKAAKSLMRRVRGRAVPRTVRRMTNTTTQSRERFLTVPDLIERWPLGRTSIYQLIKVPDFPKALVLLRDCHGQPRSMGYRDSDILAYELGHMVHASELDFAVEGDGVSSDLPRAKRATSQRKSR